MKSLKVPPVCQEAGHKATGQAPSCLDRELVGGLLCGAAKPVPDIQQRGGPHTLRGGRGEKCDPKQGCSEEREAITFLLICTIYTNYRQRRCQGYAPPITNLSVSKVL